MLTKVLEKKWVIRFFGAALILAPFMNVWLTVSGLELIPGVSKMGMFWEVVSEGAGSFQILYGSSVVIGALMLSGSVAAWKYALVLLGGYIVIQFTKLGHSFKTDKMSMVFFAINVGLFFFIADQLVWKQRPSGPRAKARADIQPQAGVVRPLAKPTPIMKASRSKVLVNLEGYGNWAQLVGVSGSGVHLRGMTPNPPKMEGREIELALKQDLVLRVKFSRQSGSDFFFEHVELTSDKVSSLNHWLTQKAA